jgi:hypothetical protein
MMALDFPLQFKRQFSKSLDVDSTFATKAELDAYLNNPLRYIGQIATCDEVEGKLFILNKTKDAWLSLGQKGDKGDKGDVGFSPIPEFRIDVDGKVYIKFQIGFESDGTTAIYTNEYKINGENGTDGKNGFSPIPSIREDIQNDALWLSFIVGYDVDNNPIKTTEINIKGSKGPTGDGAEGGSSTVSTDFTVLGVNLGMYKDGDVITKGTNLEDVMKNILKNIKPPTYVSPSLSISGSGVSAIEAGSNISPTITPIWTANDGGAVTNYRLTKNGTAVLNEALPEAFVSEAFQIGEETINFIATVSYDMGPIKQDNTGNDSPDGRIPAGTKTSGNISYTGKRNLFHGSDLVTDIIPTTSDEIRGLTGKVLGPAAGNSFTINIPTGSKKVVFAYPETIKDVSSVKYIEGLNAEVKGIFGKSTIQVQGANGLAAINYKVYTYVPAAPFGDNATYSVTI